MSGLRGNKKTNMRLCETYVFFALAALAPPQRHVHLVKRHYFIILILGIGTAALLYR